MVASGDADNQFVPTSDIAQTHPGSSLSAHYLLCGSKRCGSDDDVLRRRKRAQGGPPVSMTLDTTWIGLAEDFKCIAPSTSLTMSIG